MKEWLIGLILGFVLRQIDKFRNELNWAKLKAEAASYVADLVPGTWFDAETIKLVHVLIDAGERAMGDKENLEDLFQALSAKDWPEALMELKELVLKAWIQVRTKVKSLPIKHCLTSRWRPDDA